MHLRKTRAVFDSRICGTAGPSGRYSASGFTLTELALVVLVLAILAALLMPGVSMIRDAAKTVDCQSRMRQMFVAFHRFSTDNRGRYPITWTTGQLAQGQWCWKYWADLLLEMPIPPFTPDQPTKGMSRYNAIGDVAMVKMFYCSEDRISPTTSLSDFGWDASIIVYDESISHGFNGRHLGEGESWSKRVGKRWSQVAYPAETVLITDTMDTQFLPWRSEARAKGFQPGHGLGTIIGGVRHRKFPLLWADGHASTIRIPTETTPYAYLIRPQVLGNPNDPNADTKWDLK